MEPYSWLQSPAIRALLHKLVDKLDSAEARGSASAQTVALNDTTWPALFGATFESDKEMLWEQVLNLAEIGWIQVTPVQAGRSNQGYDQKPRLRVLNIDAVRGATGRPERQRSAVERWRDAIDANLDGPDEVHLRVVSRAELSRAKAGVGQNSAYFVPPVALAAE